MSSYNGYTNRETWAVSLHLMDTVVDLITDSIDEWSSTDVDDAAELFKDLVSEQLEQSEIATFSLLWELLDLTGINYKELGALAIENAFNYA